MQHAAVRPPGASSGLARPGRMPAIRSRAIPRSCSCCQRGQLALVSTTAGCQELHLGAGRCKTATLTVRARSASPGRGALRGSAAPARPISAALHIQHDIVGHRAQASIKRAGVPGAPARTTRPLRQRRCATFDHLIDRRMPFRYRQLFRNPVNGIGNVSAISEIVGIYAPNRQATRCER